MRQRGARFLSWWFIGTLIYGVLAGCAAIAFGLFGAWSFGMSGNIPELHDNLFLFPTQIIVPLTHGFDFSELFLHSFASGVIYAGCVAAINAARKKDDHSA